MMLKRFLRQVLFAWMLASLVTPLSQGQTNSKLSLEQLRAQRHERAHHPRRLIMNNDGCDVLYFPENEKTTVEAFLAKRTTPLTGTHVDSIAFCPTSSGFSFFTHNTQVGTLLTRSGPEYGLQPGTRNIAQDLVDLNSDCLQSVTDFCHHHGMEAFWSFRMNDTHDAAHRPEHPFLLFPPLKVDHPEWLVGNHVQRTPHGRWSSVDYARPEIRDLAFRYIEEVCNNYDVDGIELDFFRHLCYFKDPAQGKTATDEQREMITQLMRRVREVTEQAGLRRGRPILIAIRVPDSIGFCNDLGLALDRWLEEQLVDMLITTCYFRLNPWEYSVELGHKYDVPVFPCLSDSRVRGETRFRRSSLESYRGRAMNAWMAGADGLHLFNAFNPHAPMWSELGDQNALQQQDKLYFVNVRDGDPRRWLANGRDYRTVPLFGPSHPRQLIAGEPMSLEITIGDDVTRAGNVTPRARLHVEVPTIRSSEQIQATFNGTPLKQGVLKDLWIDLSIPSNALQQGENLITLSAIPDALPSDEWTASYEGRGEPAKPWTRDRGSTRTKVESVAESLLIADQGEAGGDYLYYRYPWGADPNGKSTVEARVRVKSGSSSLIVMNGISGERLVLWPDRIELYHNRKKQHVMDTTDDFHTYRMELDGKDLKVYVDGTMRIDAQGDLPPRSYYSSQNQVCFGAANSPMMGEAYWADIRLRAGGLVCSDLAVSITYE